MVQVVVAVAGVPQFRKRREGRKAEKDMAAKIRTLSALWEEVHILPQQQQRREISVAVRSGR